MKLAALLLCLTMSLCLCACFPGGILTPPVTAVPESQTPTDAPITAAPDKTAAPGAIYSFDKTVPAFSDENVSVTLPKGQTSIIDSTVQWGGLYKRYIVFSDPADSVNSTSYYVQSASSDGSTLYARFSREDFESIFKLFYEQNLGASVEIETVSYEQLAFESASGKSVEGVIYDHIVTSANGVKARQLIWSAVVDGSISITLACGLAPDAEAPDIGGMVMVK